MKLGITSEEVGVAILVTLRWPSLKVPPRSLRAAIRFCPLFGIGEILSEFGHLAGSGDCFCSAIYAIVSLEERKSRLVQGYVRILVIVQGNGFMQRRVMLKGL